MRDLCFLDLNSTFDKYVPKDLMRLKRSKMTKDMHGTIETLDVAGQCCHRVTFHPAREDELDGVQELFAREGEDW